MGLRVVAVVCVVAACHWAGVASASARGVPPDSYACDQSSFIDFEDFADGTNLSATTFPGVHFTTTNATDWVVGDFATGNYNGKYPSGSYTSRGTHWAWLGTSQGRGRIDLARPAKVFSILVSSNTPVKLEAYDREGALLTTAGPSTQNTSTGQMDELRITRTSADIAYLEVHDSGNFFLVDAVCTDAAGARKRNDSRNVPPGQDADSDFWTWPDADQDGLPDYWETNGVWVDGKYVDLANLGADDRHKDLFLWIDAVNGDYADNGVREQMRKAFDAAPLENPDKHDGIHVHFRLGTTNLDKSTYGKAASLDDVAAVLKKSAGKSGYLSDPVAGDQSVPPLYKYLFFGEEIGGGFTGYALHIPGSEAMIAVSDSYLDSFSNLVWKTGRYWPGESRAFVRAVVATHELGHLLGLRHHGNKDTPTEDKSYKSVMSYSYSTFGLPPTGYFSSAQVIDYSRSGSDDADSSPPLFNKDWRLGSGAGALKFVRGQFAVGAANYYLEWQPGEFRATDDAAPVPEASLGEQIALADPEALAAFQTQFAVPAPPSGGGPRVPAPPPAKPAPARASAKVLGWYRKALYVRVSCPRTATSSCRVTVALRSRKGHAKETVIVRRTITVKAGKSARLALPRGKARIAGRKLALELSTRTSAGVAPRRMSLGRIRTLAHRPKA